jgi:hypothetical protein
MTATTPARRPFNRVEQIIIAGQVLFGVGFGVIGFADASDPGWQDLQRLLIAMMMGLWFAGVAGAVVVGRLVSNRFGRAAVLLSLPFAGFVILIGWTLVGT